MMRSAWIVLLGAGAITGCKTTSTGGDLPPETLPSLGLPSKAFVQLQEDAPGSVRDVDTFLQGNAELGTLKLRAAGNGLSELVVDEGGTPRVIGAKSAWLQVHALAANGFRAACATRVALRGRAQGPRGVVLLFDTQKAPELVCFVNPLGSGDWKTITVATGDKPGGSVALWTFFVSVVNPDAPDDPAAAKGDAMKGIELAWFEDEHWDQGWMTTAGRTEKSGLFRRVLRLDASGTPTLSEPKKQAAYLDANQLTSQIEPQCEAEQCGALWTGRRLLRCSKVCAPTESCKNNNRCAAGTCVPRTIEAACKVAGEADRCGEMPDGCGGTVQCPSCAQGTCGGGGNPGRCGSYRINEARIRTLYNDAENRLCGSFDDGAGGTLDLSASNRVKFAGRECPKETQTCTSNLCAEKAQ